MSHHHHHDLLSHSAKHSHRTDLEALAAGLGGDDPPARGEVVDEHVAGLGQQPRHLLVHHLVLCDAEAWCGVVCVYIDEM